MDSGRELPLSKHTVWRHAQWNTAHSGEGGTIYPCAGWLGRRMNMVLIDCLSIRLHAAEPSLALQLHGVLQAGWALRNMLRYFGMVDLLSVVYLMKWAIEKGLLVRATRTSRPQVIY